MPILNDADMEQQTLPAGHYGYSGTRLANLGAAEYTLVTIVTDVSGSVAAFLREMEEALGAIVHACRSSPRADNLLLRLVTFSDKLEELHGFKQLEQCQRSQYHNVLRSGGCTALYDSAQNAIAAATAYARQLAGAGFSANGILFVLTDGMDNRSTMSVRQVREALDQAVTGESLESLVSILIGVNVRDPNVGAYLQDLKTAAGFTQYVELAQANEKTLAGLAEFVSQSIAMQSQALGSGGPSRSLTF
jgi:uncharacterized protein YegL